MKYTKAFQNLQTEATRFIDENLQGFQGVVVGLSGGVDSTALFHLICEIAKTKKIFKVGIVHVNYQLRGVESDADEAFVRDLAKTCIGPVIVRKPALDAPSEALRRGKSLQEWARDIRRAAFEEAAALGYAVVLAHHLDDVAENVLLRLSRGAAPHNLTGMTEWRAPIWRPLLKVPKNEIIEFTKLNGLSHRNDSSNDRIDYTRNMIRHRVLAELDRVYPGAAKRIVECANEARDITNFCRDSVRKNLESEPNDGLPIKFLRTLSQSIGMLVLRDFLSRTVGSHKHVSREYLKKALAWIATVPNDHDGPFQDMRGGYRLVAESGILVVRPIAAEQQETRLKTLENGVYATDQVTL